MPQGSICPHDILLNFYVTNRVEANRQWISPLSHHRAYGFPYTAVQFVTKYELLDNGLVATLVLFFLITHCLLLPLLLLFCIYIGSFFYNSLYDMRCCDLLLIALMICISFAFSSTASKLLLLFESATFQLFAKVYFSSAEGDKPERHGARRSILAFLK